MFTEIHGKLQETKSTFTGTLTFYQTFSLVYFKFHFIVYGIYNSTCFVEMPFHYT